VASPLYDLAELYRRQAKPLYERAFHIWRQVQGHRLVDGSDAYSVDSRAFYGVIFEKSSGPAWMAHYRLTDEQRQQTFDQLVGEGYRLVQSSGYSINGQAFLAGIFEQRSGPVWQAHHGLTSQQFQQILNQLTDQGYRLINVSGYVVNGQALFAGIFEQRSGPPWVAYHDLAREQNQQTFDQLTGQGYRLLKVYAYERS
jgi:Bacterial tandem repeat domain 1